MVPGAPAVSLAIPVRTERLLLRAACSGDLARLGEILHDVDVASQLLADPGLFLAEIGKAVHFSADPDHGGIAVTGVRRDDGEIVAGAFLDEDELSYFVHRDFRRRGYGTEFVVALCGEIMDQGRLARLRANVLRSNEPSRRILQSAGFAFVGLVHRTSALRPGRFPVLEYALSPGAGR